MSPEQFTGALTYLMNETMGPPDPQQALPSPPQAAMALGSAPPAAHAGADFTQALRPLHEAERSGPQEFLDEQASAERLARGGLPEPVFSAAPGPWLHAALVVDDSPSMALWQDTINQLRLMLTRAGAFRDIRIWRLDADAGTGAHFLLRGEDPGDRPLPHSPWELNDPSRRRVILVFSDGMGRAWRDGRMLRLIEQWGSSGHVSMVQPLPQRLWARCALPLAAVRIRVTHPVTENAHFQVRYRHTAEPGPGFRHQYGSDPSADDGVAIPVLSPEPRWLARWAQLVAGRAGWSDIPALFTGRPTPPAADPAPSANAMDRVRQFRATASQEAFQLAGYLAYTPVTLPIMRAVQRAMLPSSRTGHLAEVLLGGLLIRNTPEKNSPAEPGFEFHQNVRELLRSTVPRSAGLRVLRHVSQFISEGADTSIDLPAVLQTPNAAGLAALAELDRPFANVTRMALRGLGGRYAEVADQLGKVLDPVPAPSAALQDIPALPAPADEFSYGNIPIQIAVPPSRGDDVPFPPSEIPGRGRHGETPAIWIGIPPRNRNFSGRGDLLRDIRERLTSKMTALIPHALHGYGGVGKTHLAIEYAHRYQSEYDLVCWISAEQPGMVQAAMVDLATQMGLQWLTEDDAVRTVMTALRQGDSFGHWLLVFDNANKPDELERFFPTGSNSGHILLTSRNDVWAGTAQVVEVDVFPRPESIGFLRSRLGPDLSDEDADRLADRLDDLPLALDQAAAWQLETGTPADDYLRLFDERMASLREVAAVREQVRPTDYPLTVAVTWSLALDRLRAEQPEVVHLLQLCAFFAPEWIPVNLLAVGRFVQELPADLRRAIGSNRDRDRMIREIKKYALAQVDYGSSRLQLHRLAQVVLREQLLSDSEREKVRHQAHMLIAAADPGDPDIVANWERYRELWPHLQPSGSMECLHQEVRELVLNLARFLYVAGSYEAGLSFAETTLASWQSRFAEDDQDSLILLRHLGTVLRALGRIEDAEERITESYEKLRALYDDDDEETLSAGNLVGATYRDLGQFSDALRLDEELYQRHLHVFGTEHPRTLMSANNLALDYFLVGDYEKATALDQQVLQIRKQVLGDINPFTLSSEYSFARDIREAGQYQLARAQLEETLNRYTKVLGVIHPDRLRAAKHLAVARRKAGDYESARELSEQTFAAYKIRLGEDHPDTLSAAQNLINDLRLTRDFDAAYSVGTETLEKYRRTLGERHPFTLSTENNYAIVLRQAGLPREAREMSLHAFEGLERALGENHPYTLSAATTHANDLHVAGDHTLALDLLDRTYESFKAVLGKLHPYTLACGVNLIEELHCTENNERGELLADAVKERYAEVLGENHPEVIAGRTQGVRGECSTDAPHT